MSDEALLGMLPEEDAQLLLDWALRRLEEAARKTGDPDEFLVAADGIRAEARRIAARAVDGASSPELLQPADLGGDTTRRAAGSLPPQGLLAPAAPHRPRIAAAGPSVAGRVSSSGAAGRLLGRVRRFFGGGGA